MQPRQTSRAVFASAASLQSALSASTKTIAPQPKVQLAATATGPTAGRYGNPTALPINEDEAVGHLEKNADGKLAIARVELRPQIVWGGDRKPTTGELDKMHHAAHENCFIANSVKTEVSVTKI